MKIVRQSNTSECMLACFTMIANHHGDLRSLREFRSLHPDLTAGASLRDFLRVCEDNNLLARPVRAESKDLGKLTLPALLHWNNTHFVVLSKVSSSAYQIHNPASGVEKYTKSEFDVFYSGIASEVHPQANFSAHAASPTIGLRQVVQLGRETKFALLYLFVVGLLLQLFLAISPLAIQATVDSVIHNNDFDLLPIIIFAFFSITVISGLLEYLREVSGLSILAGLRYMANYNLLNRLLLTEWSFFNHRRVALILSYFKSFEYFSNYIAFGLVIPFIDFVAMILIMALVVAYNPLLAAVVFSITICVTFIRFFISEKSRKYQQEVVRTSAENEAFVFETLSGIQTIKNNGIEQRRSRLYTPVLQRFVDSTFKATRFESRFGLFVKIFRALEYAVVVYILASAVMLQQITLGMMYAFIIYRDMIEARFESVLHGISSYLNLPAHLDQVSDFVHAQKEHDRAVNANPINLLGTIDIRDISVTPPGGRNPVLINFSNSIREGEFVAITGSSGAGKTTLINTLLGLTALDSGDIFVGGTAIVGDQQKHFKNSCGVVMQSDMLFSGSILDNVCLFDEMPDMSRAIHSCQLASFEKELESFPMGVNTNVGDMGGALSSGQRQRILLARAFYRRPSIFVLDEATANMDGQNENVVIESLRNTGRTVIFSTHSKNVVQAADRIINIK